MTIHPRAEKAERGQILVIVGAGMIVLVAMVGLVIDGGFAWGKLRETQNAADSMSKAGAVVLAENVAGVSPANTDFHVDLAVLNAADANDIDDTEAFYTNIDGQMITPSGALAASEATAARVGGGVIPVGAAGVRAVPSQTFDTFLARVIGITEFTARADAVAVAGYLTGTCPASAGCIVLPVTFPVTVLGCDGSNKPAPATDEDGDKILWSVTGEPVSIPLCQSGPGNVGWLDWNPNESTPGCPGTGNAELACVIENPTNPYLSWPGWYQVSNTGNTNSPAVEDAMNIYSGQTVLIPQFDITCKDPPTGPLVIDCPEGSIGGVGSQQWYHIAGMSAFTLCHSSIPECAAKNFNQAVYTSGAPAPQCDTGNGGTSCLTGIFVDISYEGEVTASPGANIGTSVVGIQLIR